MQLIRSLADLPSVSSDRQGWPWTESSPLLPPTMLNGMAWPRVTVVTPSYNQGQFLEETIRSVLLQGYPNLEYFVIDGGSSDDSVDIIKRYAPWLDYWVSEKDRGQCHAINKGFERATGSYVAWLNSDDVYYPGALEQLVTVAIAHPQAGLIYGDCDQKDAKLLNPSGENTTGPWDYKRLLDRCYIGQPATLINRELLGPAIFLDESLHYSLDWDLWLRIGAITDGVYIAEPLAISRVWEDAKTFTTKAQYISRLEQPQILHKLLNNSSLTGAKLYYAKWTLGRAYLLLGRFYREQHNFGKSIINYGRGFFIQKLAIWSGFVDTVI